MATAFGLKKDEAVAIAGAVLAEHKAREQEARATLTRTQLDIAELDKRLYALSTRERQLERLGAAILRDQRKNEISRELKLLERVIEELRETDAQLAQIHVKPKAVERLDELERRIASLDAQLSAAAAQLAIEVKPNGVGQVHVGTQPAKGSYSAPIVAPTKITVGELAVITITPAMQSR